MTIYKSILTAIALSFFASNISQAQVIINEILSNPSASDTGAEFFELRGTSGMSLNNHWLLSIEGDNSSAGTIDEAIELGDFVLGANGLLVVREGTAGSPLVGTTTVDNTELNFENGANSFLLVTGFTGAIGDDLDDAGGTSDGVIDSTPWTSVIDSIGWTDGAGDGFTYAAALGGIDIDAGGLTTSTAFRENLSGDWYLANVTAAGEPAPFEITEFVNQSGTLIDPTGSGFNFLTTSVGQFNPEISAVPEPGSAIALTMLSLIAGLRRRRRRA